MAFFDLPISELKNYKPDRNEPQDFDSFWQDSIDAVKQYALDASFVKKDYGLTAVETFDVSFKGYAGQTIKAWLIMPAETKRKLPCVVQFVGYGGGRGFPVEHLMFAGAGFAHLIMDTRGQGSKWSVGDTPDIEVDGGNAQVPGVMTRGILDPKTYYYHRLYMDGVRAVEAARSFDAVDSEKIALRGHSQGGGVALAVSALVPYISAAMINEPFLCHFRRAVEITDSYPYYEIVEYCRTHRNNVETVFQTLSYFDGMYFAARSHVPALFSVALMDETCPPSTIYAAYNHYQGPKDIHVYEFNQHDGGGVFQDIENLKYLHNLWG